VFRELFVNENPGWPQTTPFTRLPGAGVVRVSAAGGFGWDYEVVFAIERFRGCVVCGLEITIS